MFSCPFQIQRLTLLAGIQTPITPPLTCSSVTISNRTLGDVRIITDPAGVNYGILSSCFEEQINLSQAGSATSLFHDNQVNFYLQADVQGDVVLTWT
jgi:hypothetical protein